MDWFASLFDEGKTYMFELTSPFNKVVVQWHETRLNFLGVRDNVSLQETYFTEHPLKDVFHTPKVFSLHSLQECIEAAEKLGPSDEGYVVCDKDFNRVKVKSVLYVSLHHMKGNNILSYERGLDIVKSNEICEVVQYFPEFKEHLEQIELRYNEIVSSLENAWIEFNKNIFESRRDQAVWIQKNFKIPGCGFCLLDGKCESVKDWILKIPTKNLVKWLGFKD
jgi:hypothetical protein